MHTDSRPATADKGAATNGDDADDDDEDGGYMNYGHTDDYMRFTGDILGYAAAQSDHRHDDDGQRRSWGAGGGGAGNWQHVELANSAERDEQRTRDLEGMFARGVRGLLTSYMQRALQPAIKETLMESLGYRLSYG